MINMLSTSNYSHPFILGAKPPKTTPRCVLSGFSFFVSSHVPCHQASSAEHWSLLIQPLPTSTPLRACCWVVCRRRQSDGGNAAPWSSAVLLLLDPAAVMCHGTGKDQSLVCINGHIYRATSKCWRIWNQLRKFRVQVFSGWSWIMFCACWIIFDSCPSRACNLRHERKPAAGQKKTQMQKCVTWASLTPMPQS